MTARYRTGNHWGTTIIREGAQPADESGRRSDDTLVAVVDSAAMHLAARIAALLSDACDCGHDGLDAMFHLRPCPVAEVREAARHLGYGLVRNETEAP